MYRPRRLYIQVAKNWMTKNATICTVNIAVMRVRNAPACGWRALNLWRPFWRLRHLRGRLLHYLDSLGQRQESRAGRAQ